MNHFRYIFVGFLATFASAWIGLALVPAWHYGKKEAALPVVTETAEAVLVRQGELVYAANGCIYCHSQQVRSAGFGSDQARGWGSRRTVSDDYLGDGKAMMGTMRTGPDLANIGSRNPSTAWHYQHLYQPVSTSPGSIMPAYAYLFEWVPAGAGQLAPDALVVGPEGAKTDAQGRQLVPTAEGRALVAYLLSMKRSLIPRAEADEAANR